MKWQEYKKKFISTALASGYSEITIEPLLKYAEYLFANNVPVIYDQRHFSMLVGYDYDLILKISNSSSHFYKEYSIPKSNGEKRLIREPLPTLKEIQNWILEHILSKTKIHPAAKAYVKGLSIKDNARFHKNQNKLLSIDIKNFFENIGEKKVYNFFRQLGYNKEVAMILCQICCCQGSLPQGAPTSPMLSNIIFKICDLRIFGFCKINSIRYTRYADDMSFSGDFDGGKLIKIVSKILNENNYSLNDRKTKVRLQHQQQQVTGIVVNEYLQVPREYRRKLRQQIYYIRKFGIREQTKVYNFNSSEKYVKNLLGKANHIKFVNPNDSEVEDYINFLHQLITEN